MQSYSQKNWSVIEKRWPQLYAQLQPLPGLNDLQILVDGDNVVTMRYQERDLASRYDRLAEARIRADSVPEDTSEVWLYGIGLGELPQLLAARSALSALHIVVFNRSLFKEILEIIDHTGWLIDERVQLYMATELHEVGVPFVAVPSCLQAAETEAARLRDLVQLELNTPYINARFEARRPELELCIRENRAAISQDGDVAELFGTAVGQTLVVAAAGPSLDEMSSTMDSFGGDNPVICVDASLKPLLDQGIVPQIVLTIDAARCNIGAYFDFDLSQLKTSTLVYFPVVSPEVVAAWPGRRVCAYGTNKLYAEIQAELPRTTLVTSGSVLHAAVDLAVMMRASAVILCGADFGMPAGRHYARGVNREVRADEFALGPYWVIDGHGKRIASQPNLIGYLRDLEHQLTLYSEVQFFNASRSGARITGVCYLDEYEKRNGC